jgi:hypothetical protein
MKKDDDEGIVVFDSSKTNVILPTYVSNWLKVQDATLITKKAQELAKMLGYKVNQNTINIAILIIYDLWSETKEEKKKRNE